MESLTTGPELDNSQGQKLTPKSSRAISASPLSSGHPTAMLSHLLCATTGNILIKDEPSLRQAGLSQPIL
jgi:hypothetical protein